MGRLRWVVGALATIAVVSGPVGAQTVRQGAQVEVDGTTYQVPAAQSHGFHAIRWDEIPRGVLADPWSDGAVGVGVARGRRVSMRAGSPFVRVGSRVEVLANAPYVEANHMWVPLELLGRLGSDTKASAAPGESAAQEPEIPALAPVATSESRRPGPWRIVIDPGHGGRDPGTRSRKTGSSEKDVALAVARELHARLQEHPDFDAFLTRSDDRFVELAERPRIADRNDGDLFVSLHVNAERGRGTRAMGFETYYLGQSKSEESRAVAIRENSVLEFEGGRPDDGGDIEFILAGLDRDEHLNSSRRVAGYIQNGFRSLGHSRDRGVKRDVFRVLVNATGRMPAVLVELGFITHADEERRLTSRSGQRQMASALASSIASYFGSVDRRRAGMDRRP